MALLDFLFGKKGKEETEEEKRLREETERLHGEAVKRLKERAQAIEQAVKAVAEENDFESLSPVQFVKYARVLEEDEPVEHIVPAHYTNKALKWNDPGHVLFLPERFLFISDEWEAKHRALSFRYADIVSMKKKRGIFQSTVTFAVPEGKMDGEIYHPEGGQDRFIFYLKWEYRMCSSLLEKYLEQARREATAEGRIELAARKEAAAEKARNALLEAQAAFERAEREAKEAKRAMQTNDEMNEIDKY